MCSSGHEAVRQAVRRFWLSCHAAIDLCENQAEFCYEFRRVLSKMILEIVHLFYSVYDYVVCLCPSFHFGRAHILLASVFRNFNFLSFSSVAMRQRFKRRRSILVLSNNDWPPSPSPFNFFAGALRAGRQNSLLVGGFFLDYSWLLHFTVAKVGKVAYFALWLAIRAEVGFSVLLWCAQAQPESLASAFYTMWTGISECLMKQRHDAATLSAPFPCGFARPLQF